MWQEGVVFRHFRFGPRICPQPEITDCGVDCEAVEVSRGTLKGGVPGIPSPGISAWPNSSRWPGLLGSVAPRMEVGRSCDRSGGRV